MLCNAPQILACTAIDQSFGMHSNVRLCNCTLMYVCAIAQCVQCVQCVMCAIAHWPRCLLPRWATKLIPTGHRCCAILKVPGSVISYCMCCIMQCVAQCVQGKIGQCLVARQGSALHRGATGNNAVTCIAASYVVVGTAHWTNMEGQWCHAVQWETIMQLIDNGAMQRSS